MHLIKIDNMSHPKTKVTKPLYYICFANSYVVAKRSAENEILVQLKNSIQKIKYSHNVCKKISKNYNH